ncbi:MAG: signal peptidase I [Verrucomicrobia bacterium CG_4_10_14_3_um_filter_43_23]|nr:MAG: signal peptidase I [Verrucomicrobia bacterium CG1_02_43_26]PIP59860.1 MAG: signal peptidase I [Verrucomicrobia bacterium CG22_combo_CG10-13_8_21_14_all_43_17]PIX58410.1 MAG: signal peptidase I [Verrucomicrobia bacterium CG_4_10_14_3_um_filter_43_23]PIY61558.1 MAG: signal peptidase I [Verrucomicrobia bacterium CG_4_10_14_0_8_um_filter_43_34]PJA43635.1 MAG: signal peptidase I [Verrucomicrobia bacterium CG_4_9_14_3_um_filter_43_20]
MFFKSSPRKKLIKQAETTVHLAKKVLAYRKDVLDPADVESITRLRGELLRLKKDKGSTGKALEQANRELDKVLKKCGGTIYPVTFWSENVEMILVAAILAIGIRAFFFQPFEIPTNSMYPTYNGMTSQVYTASDEEPGLAKRFIRAITLGSSHYNVTAQTAGQVSIPIFDRSDALNIVRYEKVGGRKWFGLLPAAMREYTLYVNGQPLAIKVPLEFSLDETIRKTFFPKDLTLSKAITRAAERGEIAYSPQGLMINTNQAVEEGKTVLAFDLLAGDKLFVDRITYHFKRPKIGDPFVFRTINVPGLRGEDKYYIKRLVGLPGDILEVKEPVLYRNSSPIEGAAAFNYNANLEGEYRGYGADRRLASGLQEIVPANSFYAMGDNSHFSADSRYWGFVPEREVVGKAGFVFYPFSKRWGLAK